MVKAVLDVYKRQEQAEAALKTAQAQLEYARSNYSRMKEAKVVVAVYDENGKIATGVPVKM